MKRTANKLTTDEKGQAMILVLILLLVGALIIAPLLGFMGTGLMAGQTFENKMDEFYAADAGVEDGLWNLIWGGLVVSQGTPVDRLPFQMNEKTVNVNIMNIDETMMGGGFRTTLYKITATVGGTQVIAYIRIASSWFTDSGLPIVGGDFVWAKEDGDWQDDVYVDGDVLLGDDAEIDKPNGDLYIYGGGDIILGEDAEIEADKGSLYIYAGGSIILGGSPNSEVELEAEKGDIYIYAVVDIIMGVDTEIESEEGDVYIYAGGNITMGEDVEIETDNGDICISVGGNLTIDSIKHIQTKPEYSIWICAGGDVFVSDSLGGDPVRITADFYVGGTMTIDSNVEITGDIYTDNPVVVNGIHNGNVYPYEDCPCWGMGSPSTDVIVWDIN